MERNQSNWLKIFIVTTAAGCAFFLGTGKSVAGDPEYVKLDENKPFVFSAGAGYGISNNICKSCDSNSPIGGATFALSMGYKINSKFTIEFGPSFWIEGNDLINKNVADSERPNNKRTLVTFTGTWSPFKTCLLSVRLGGGAGIINYTPEKTSVKSDENKFESTEIFKGYSGTFGLSYELKLCPKIKVYPLLNIWYIQTEQPAIAYDSYINYKKASVTSEVRINFKYSF